MASGSTSNYDLPYPKSTDKVRVAGDIEQLATKIDNILLESIEDGSAAMWTGGTFSNGLNSPTYNDSTGKMSMSLSQDLQTSASPTFSALMVTNNASVNGGILSTSATSASLFNNNATSLNIGGAATTVSIGSSTGTFTVNNANAIVAGDLAVNGGDITSSSTSFNLLNATVTTLNIGGAATTVSAGAGTGTFTINNASVVVSGDMAINGGDITTNQATFNMINTSTTTLNVGGEATVVNIGNSSGQTNFAGDVNIATGKIYKINNVSVLSATTLGSSVINSSLTSVGTISSGTWQGSTISASYGGTGQSSYAIGDIIYASASTTLTKLNIGTNNFVLTSNGSAPVWTTNTGSGSVVFSSSPTLTGTPTSTTAAADTNTTQIATTAYVVGQASSVTPIMDGVAAIGTSLRYARADHVHASDTSRAALSGATFTGTIVAPAATTSLTPVRIPHGTTPTTPTNGDVWTTTAGLYVQINGTTVGPLGTGSGTAGGSFEMLFFLGGM